jgi:hypothetical protein
MDERPQSRTISPRRAPYPRPMGNAWGAEGGLQIHSSLLNRRSPRPGGRIIPTGGQATRRAGARAAPMCSDEDIQPVPHSCSEHAQQLHLRASPQVKLRACSVRYGPYPRNSEAGNIKGERFTSKCHAHFAQRQKGNDASPTDARFSPAPSCLRKRCGQNFRADGIRGISRLRDFAPTSMCTRGSCRFLLAAFSCSNAGQGRSSQS